ncbi:MAG: pantoate--beta-alanine ligase [Candidatus Cloacimonetes bacterium HGW-Cloacimonetes-1]|jgi:pantoate--beta-alanine ligase|nr:MAG: pantoate--beta-alanine ligase [Candidatus Cloacimonetes bacterium HGW-Cloacimonetes-1]
MQIIRTAAEMQEISAHWQPTIKVGFIPTMGYLHAGHLSLISRAKEECDVVIVSIFVNPAQFGANEDLGNYPRDLDRDLSLMGPLNVDYVFFPTGEMMYPAGYKTWIEVKGISDILCGASRPGHFIGVATVVLKLVNIVRPTLMYMGEKDYQQVAVLETMLRDLNVPTTIVRCPIVREEDGLAMSSRNKYLDSDQRVQALCLANAIRLAQKQFLAGNHDPQSLIELMSDLIIGENGSIDYIRFVDPIDLADVQSIKSDTRIILAVYIGKTRLIDNSAVLA